MDTVSRLRILLNERPELIDHCLSKNLSDPIFWDAVFVHFFGRLPVDPGELPMGWKVGSTDPLWDELISVYGAWRAHDQIKTELRVQELNKVA